MLSKWWTNVSAVITYLAPISGWYRERKKKFLSWPHPWQADAPRPGTEPASQQEQCWALNHEAARALWERKIYPVHNLKPVWPDLPWLFNLRIMTKKGYNSMNNPWVPPPCLGSYQTCHGRKKAVLQGRALLEHSSFFLINQIPFNSLPLACNRNGWGQGSSGSQTGSHGRILGSHR